MTSVRKLPGMDSLVKTAAALSRSATNLFRSEAEPIPGIRPVGKLPEWKVMCQEAKELAQKGEKEEALMMYHRALRMRPNAPEIKTAIRNLSNNITESIQASKTMKLFSTMKMMAHKKKTRKSSITGADLLENLQEEERQASARSLIRERSLTRDIPPPPSKPSSNTRILPPIGSSDTGQPTTQQSAAAVPAIAINDETIQQAGIERERTKLTLAKPLSDSSNGSHTGGPGDGAPNGAPPGTTESHAPEPTNKDNPPGAGGVTVPGIPSNLEAPAASPRSARRKRSSRHRSKKAAEVTMPPLVFRSLQSLHSEGGGGASSRASSRISLLKEPGIDTEPPKDEAVPPETANQGLETADKASTLQGPPIDTTASSAAEVKQSVDHAMEDVPEPTVETLAAAPPVVIVSQADSVDNDSSSSKSETSGTSGSQPNAQSESPPGDKDVKLSKDKGNNTPFDPRKHWEKAKSFYRSPRVSAVDVAGLLQREKTLVKALPGINPKSLHRPALRRSSTTLVPKTTRAANLRKNSSLKSANKESPPSASMPPTLRRSSTTLAKAPLSTLPPIHTSQQTGDNGKQEAAADKPEPEQIRQSTEKPEVRVENADIPEIKVQDSEQINQSTDTSEVKVGNVETLEIKVQESEEIRQSTDKPEVKVGNVAIPEIKVQSTENEKQNHLDNSQQSDHKAAANTLKRPTEKPKSSKKARQIPKEGEQPSLVEAEQAKRNIVKPEQSLEKDGPNDINQKAAQETVVELRQPSGKNKKATPVTKKPLPKQPTLTPKPLVRSRTAVKLTPGNMQKPQGPIRSTTSLQLTKNKTVITKQNDPIRNVVLKAKSEVQKDKEAAQPSKSKMPATGRSAGRRKGTVAPRRGQDKVALQKRLEEEQGMPLNEMPEDVRIAFHKACAKATILAKSNVALTVKAREQPRPDSRTADWHQEAPEFLLESTQRLEAEERPNSSAASPREYALAELKRIQADFDEERYEKARYRSKVVLERTQDAPVSADFSEAEKQNVLANLYSLQGNASLELGLMEEALDAHLKDLGIGTDFGLLDSKSRALSNVGRVHARAGRFRDAIDVWGDKVALCVSAGERAWLFHEMGRCYYELAEYADAQELADRSSVNANETTDSHMQFQACYLLAQCYERLQALEEALIEYKKALDLAVVSDNEEEVARIEEAIQRLNAKLAGQMVEKRVRRRTRLAKVVNEDENGPLTARGISVDGLPSGKSSPTSDLYYLTMLYVMATLPEY